MYSLDDYDYDLPQGLVAQEPMARRTHSRLMVLERGESHLNHLRFENLVDLLHPGDVLVLNDTRVIPGRLAGRKESGGKVEVLVLDYPRGIQTGEFECLVRASRRPKAGSRLFFDGGAAATVVRWTAHTGFLTFDGPSDLETLLDTFGHMPLPPYIQRQDTPADRSAYQTVYARHKGAIAAPTAGLHFSQTLLRRLEERGVGIAYLTLHVGYGTFVPVRVDDIRDHDIHAEWYTLTPAMADKINVARSSGGRLVAVGTTSVRTLEYCADDAGRVRPGTGMCDLFIYPGYAFKVVDAMVTNFHLPRSTLLMLVSAFAGRKRILEAYAEAIKRRYRFYSYGDAMLLY